MDKKIEHLGSLEGKLLIFGGVYSNLQALEALMQVAHEHGIAPENCICTGDIVGYCAQPEETVALFHKWGANSIAGNVELQLSEGLEDCGCDFTQGSRCDDFSKLWYPYAQSKLSSVSINWMKQLPNYIVFNYAGEKVTVVHGSFDNVSEFIFESTSTAVKLKSFTTSQSNVILAGHCGLPFYQEIENKLWLNPGVIGMPANDGTPRVWYMLLENIGGKLEYTHQYLNYKNKVSYRLMKENYLPMEYAETLLSGLWDNMEILPDAEKMLQGNPYNFDVKTMENQYKN